MCDRSEIVIDGFTRSACVFAAVAFQQSQPRPVRLAHLLHAPAHLIEGARRGVPCLVMVRHPEGAVVSSMLREPYLTPGQALAAWTRFYSRLLPWRDRMVVGEFSRVTTDLGSLVEQLNHRYGTRFTLFQPTEENVRRVFSFIEERASRPSWERDLGLYMSGLLDAGQLEATRAAAGERTPRRGGVPFEHRVARPSLLRNSRRPELVERYHDRHLAAARGRAEELFAIFTAGITPGERRVTGTSTPDRGALTI
ncbi:MAG: hypothetical protein ACXVYV_05550 [Gaiellales bacterium]